MDNNLSQKFISHDSIKRLIRDIKEIMKSPLIEEGIYYKHDQTDMLKGYAMIIGPKDTPYENGYYFFQFNYPVNYPFSPPNVIYCTNDGLTRFNPNFYKNGKVCISVLNTWSGEQWTSCQTISSILLILCSLLNNNPLLNEPGITNNDFHKKECILYKNIIEYKNIEIAIASMIIKDKYFNLEFDIFYDDMKEIFNKNYIDLISKIEKKLDYCTIIQTKTYNMKFSINYNNLLCLIKECYNKINNKIELKI